MSSKQQQQKRDAARRKLVRKVRRLIGKGRTDMERGYYWMNFSAPVRIVRNGLNRKFDDDVSNFNIEEVHAGVGNRLTFERWIWTVKVDGFEFDIIHESDAKFVRISYM